MSLAVVSAIMVISTPIKLLQTMHVNLCTPTLKLKTIHTVKEAPQPPARHTFARRPQYIFTLFHANCIYIKGYEQLDAH